MHFPYFHLRLPGPLASQTRGKTQTKKGDKAITRRSRILKDFPLAFTRWIALNMHTQLEQEILKVKTQIFRW